MDIKCKLCEAPFETDEELNDHWEGLHNKEWRELQKRLKEGDRAEQTHIEVANEGMKTLAAVHRQPGRWTRGEAPATRGGARHLGAK